jgi:hypothetical protein
MLVSERQIMLKKNHYISNSEKLGRENNIHKKHTMGWSSMITPQGLTWRCAMGAIAPINLKS